MNEDDDIGRLAELIHDEQCNDTPGCARRDRHEQYYRDRAAAIIGALEPEIGIANVFTAVRAILDELWLCLSPRSLPCASASAFSAAACPTPSSAYASLRPC